MIQLMGQYGTCGSVRSDHHFSTNVNVVCYALLLLVNMRERCGNVKRNRLGGRTVPLAMYEA
jgi:hypothetical protein